MHHCDNYIPHSRPAQTDVFVLGFSLANRDSFNHVRERWLPELEHFGHAGTAKVLVGLKADLRTSAGGGDDVEGSLVSPSEADTLAAEMGVVYRETSSLAGTGLRELEQDIISLYVAQRRSARARRDNKPLRRFFDSLMGGSDNSDNGLRATPVQPNPPQLPPAPKAPWMEMLPTSLGEDWCSLLGDLGLVSISGRGTSEGGGAGAVASEDAPLAKASDCDVVVGCQSFKAHRAVLAAAVPSLRPTLGMQARVDPGEDASASVNSVSGAFDLNGNGGNDRVKLVVADRVSTTTALSGTTISTTSTNATAATFSHVLLFVYSGDPQMPSTSTEEHIAAVS